MQTGMAIKMTTKAITIIRKKPSKKLVPTAESFSISVQFETIYGIIYIASTTMQWLFDKKEFFVCAIQKGPN